MRFWDSSALVPLLVGEPTTTNSAGASTAWQEVQPAEPVRRTAQRFLRVHVLRAADALQVAAAIAVAEGDPGSVPFVSLDGRQREAAEREGFRVEPADVA